MSVLVGSKAMPLIPNLGSVLFGSGLIQVWPPSRVSRISPLPLP